MFTFALFLLLSGLCFVIYVYFSNKLVTQRKQIMLLTAQNTELKDKLNKLKGTQIYTRVKSETHTEFNKPEVINPQEDE